MEKRLWTSGQVSGLTEIPSQTLRRYIHDYPDFFSKTGRQSSKGRRYTEEDISNLMLIRHLYQSHYGKEKIVAALAGNWIPPVCPQYDKRDSFALLEKSQDQMAKTLEYAQQARKDVEKAETIIKSASHIMDKFWDVIKGRIEHKQQIPVILDEIKEIKKRLAQLEENARPSQRESEPHKFFGLFSQKKPYTDS